MIRFLRAFSLVWLVGSGVYATPVTLNGGVSMLSISANSSVSFPGGVVFHADGRITADPRVKPDIAARKVLEALRQMTGHDFGCRSKP